MRPSDDRRRRRDLLETAFRATRYEAATPVGTLVIRVGRRSPALDRLLAATGHVSWVYLTAENPRARRITPADNARRTRDLASRLAATGLPVFEGASRAERGDWPAETSFLVIGLESRRALALARRFGQAAILAGERGRAARLVFCAAAGAPTMNSRMRSRRSIRR